MATGNRVVVTLMGGGTVTGRMVDDRYKWYVIAQDHGPEVRFDWRPDIGALGEWWSPALNDAAESIELESEYRARFL